MKQGFVILMIAAVALPSLHKLGLLIDFKINQDFITENFCVNKNEPVIMCHGKCYLSQKFEEAERQQNKAPGAIQKTQTDVLNWDVKEYESQFLLCPEAAQASPIAYLNIFHILDLPGGIFRPPRQYLIG